MEENRILLSVKEAAEILGYSKSFLYLQASEGKIPIIRLGRTARIPRKWLEEWVAGETKKWEAAHHEK